MLKRAALAAAAACAAVLAVPAVASAGGGGGLVQCQGQECTLYSSHTSSPGMPGTLTGHGGRAGSGPAAKPPCTVGNLAGTWGYYVGRYGWTRVCITPGTVAGGPAAPAAAAPDPAVLAQLAVQYLRLPDPVIRSSPAPGALQLTRLPTWLWIAPAIWRPQSRTAQVPGESVTATATPVAASWSMGDGHTVTCRGPGTPYKSGDSPAAASPTCGYTYTRSSAGQPGAAFHVTVTITWDITWTATGGAGGTLPPLSSAAAAALRVAESQAVNTTGGA